MGQPAAPALERVEKAEPTSAIADLFLKLALNGPVHRRELVGCSDEEVAAAVNVIRPRSK